MVLQKTRKSQTAKEKEKLRLLTELHRRLPKGTAFLFGGNGGMPRTMDDVKAAVAFTKETVAFCKQEKAVGRL